MFNKNVILFDVLIHELLMELAPERVVDESFFLLFRFGSGAVLKDHIVVPSSLDSEI